MDLTQLACPRCGLTSTFISHLLHSSKLHSSPAGTRDAMPNCPYCSRPLALLSSLELAAKEQAEAESPSRQAKTESPSPETPQPQPVV
jgi:hypothetical protein